MSRIIKFKAKSLVNIPDNGNIIIAKGEWVYGGLVYDCNRVWIDTEYYGQILVDKNTVSEFTGIYDKNGKEIYDGDIIKYNQYWEGDYYFPDGYGIIMWDKEESMFFLSAESPQSQWIDLFNLTRNLNSEVIGNIIDNKNLSGEE